MKLLSTLELNQDQWTSFDIPLSSFTDQNPLVDFSNIIQFKFEGVNSGEGTIFIDNLYFYKVPSELTTGIVGTWKVASDSWCFRCRSSRRRYFLVEL